MSFLSSQLLQIRKHILVLVTIDLAGKSTIADYMVVATGRSSRQVAALAENLLPVLKEFGIVGVRPEGARQGEEEERRL